MGVKHEAIFSIFEKQSFGIIEECGPDKDEQKKTDESMFRYIERRCAELTKLHPGKRKIFENYIKTQKEEFDILENKIQCVTWLLKRIK